MMKGAVNSSFGAGCKLVQQVLFLFLFFKEFSSLDQYHSNCYVQLSLPKIFNFLKISSLSRLSTRKAVLLLLLVFLLSFTVVGAMNDVEPSQSSSGRG